MGTTTSVPTIEKTSPTASTLASGLQSPDPLAMSGTTPTGGGHRREEDGRRRRRPASSAACSSGTPAARRARA
jgi:hypothetical protein